MSMSRDAAAWILWLAARAAPPGRGELALAMRRELEFLDRGRLRWALGCLGTVARWRIAADGLYVALIAIFPLILGGLDFWLIVNLRIHGDVPLSVIRAWLPAWWLLQPFLAALVIGAYRPRAAVATALLCFAWHMLHHPLHAYLTKGTPMLAWFGYNEPYASVAIFAAWYFGAAAGARLARRRAKPLAMQDCA